MSNCKSCGAEIKWMKTESGKNIPVDVPPVEQETKYDLVLTESVFKPGLMTAHFATCPNANKHRKTK